MTDMTDTAAVANGNCCDGARLPMLSELKSMAASSGDNEITIISEGLKKAFAAIAPLGNCCNGAALN